MSLDPCLSVIPKNCVGERIRRFNELGREDSRTEGRSYENLRVLVKSDRKLSVATGRGSTNLDDGYDKLNFAADEPVSDITSKKKNARTYYEAYQLPGAKKLQDAIKVEIAAVEYGESGNKAFRKIMDGGKLFGEEAKKSLGRLFGGKEATDEEEEEEEESSSDDDDNFEENIYETIDEYSDVQLYDQTIDSYRKKLGEVAEEHDGDAYEIPSFELAESAELTELTEPPSSNEFISTKCLRILHCLVESERKYVDGLRRVREAIGEQRFVLPIDLAAFHEEQTKLSDKLMRMTTKMGAVVEAFQNHEPLLAMYTKMGRFIDVIDIVNKNSAEQICLTHPLSRLRQYIHFVENCAECTEHYADALNGVTARLKLCMTESNARLALQSIAQQIFTFGHTGRFLRRQEFRVKTRGKRRSAMVFLFEKLMVFAKFDGDKNGAQQLGRFRFKMAVSLEHVVEVEGRNRTVDILRYDGLSQTNERVLMRAKKAAIANQWVTIIEGLRPDLN